MNLINTDINTDGSEFISKQTRQHLMDTFPTWIPTNSIAWKKSDEALLTHEIKEIRDRAKARLNQ